MNIKAKHVLLLGAFIVLTLLGYRFLPRDEIVIQTNEEEKLGSSLSNNFNQNLENNLFENSQQNLQNDINANLEEMIFVHIEGAINFPGIKEVPKGTRLFEVIEVAGGTTVDADVSKVNLASIVKDEQKIYVPFLENENITNRNDEVINPNANKYDSNAYNKKEGFENNHELININYATEEELQNLEGIGPSMAKKIIEYREQNGYFSSIEEIKNVSGIGESKYNKIKDNITI